MANLQTIKKLNIQINDFVDVKTVNGIVAIQVIDILNTGIIHGLDVDGFERRFNAKLVIENHFC